MQLMINIFKLKSLISKPKVKIISAYDDRFSKIGKISEASIKNYANHFKFDHEIYKINRFKERPPAWYKIKVLIENLKNDNYDYIIWVDSDAFFCRYENIIDYIDKSKNLSLVFHNVLSQKRNKETYFNNIIYAPNTGFMVFKNCDWSRRFLELIWSQKKFINHPNWDNAAVYSILGYNSEIKKKNKNIFNKKFFDKIHKLPLIWNSIPSRDCFSPSNVNITLFEFNPVIIHLAGMRRKNRKKFIKFFKKNFI